MLEEEVSLCVRTCARVYHSMAEWGVQVSLKMLHLFRDTSCASLCPYVPMSSIHTFTGKVGGREEEYIIIGTQ